MTNDGARNLAKIRQRTYKGYFRKRLLVLLFSLFPMAVTLAGCQKRTYSNVTLMTSQPWLVGQTKSCFITGDSKDDMNMHCAAFGDPDTTFDGYIKLVDVHLDRPVHSHGIYGVICRLDSDEHATCAAGEMGK